MFPSRWTIRTLFVLWMVMLVGCEQVEKFATTDHTNTSLKSAGTGCWEDWGVCAATKWKSTGVIYPDKPERVEIIVVTELTNNCNPDPKWFRAEDPEMEELARQHSQNPPKDKVEALFRKSIEEGLNVYRARSDLDCSQVQFTIGSFTLFDKYGVELYQHSTNAIRFLDPQFKEAEDKADDKNRVQAKFSIPLPYLSQIANIVERASVKRIWKNGMKREEVDFTELERRRQEELQKEKESKP